MSKLWIVGRNDAFYTKVFSDRASAELFRDEQNESVYNGNGYRVMDGEIAMDSGIEVVDPDQRVRMTQAEYDEFKSLEGGNAYHALNRVANYKEVYPSLYKRLFSFNRVESNIAQAEFTNLWKNYRSEEPDVTIKIEEIIEKWFVRTSYREGNYHYWMTKMNYSDAFPKFEYDTKPSEDAMEFESEEEAEEWLNPQLEVIKLEVVK